LKTSSRSKVERKVFYDKKGENGGPLGLFGPKKSKRNAEEKGDRSEAPLI